MDMETPTPQNNAILERIETGQALAGYGAIGVIPFIRRKAGLRTVRFLHVLPAAAFTIGAGYFLGEDKPLIAYGCTLLLVSQYQQFNRWKELRKGRLTHTLSLGQSPLASVPFAKVLPPRAAEWLIDGDRIHRLYDPVLVFLAGLGLYHGSYTHYLGEWLMFSACCLRIFEEYKFNRTVNKLLDMLDQMLEGETLRGFMEAAQGAKKGPVTDPATGRQMSGMTDTLREQIEKRQRESEAKEELARRQALANAEAARHTAAADAPPPTVRETVIIQATESRETVREKETVIIGHETVQPVLIAVPVRPPVETAAPGPALATGNGHQAGLDQAAAPALPAPPKELPPPQDGAAPDD